MINRFLCVTLVGLCLSATAAFAQIKKVRLAIPTVDLVTLPLKMAQAKGFYQKGGLDVEIILIAGALGVRAVLGNSVEFSTASDRSWRPRHEGYPSNLCPS